MRTTTTRTDDCRSLYLYSFIRKKLFMKTWQKMKTANLPERISTIKRPWSLGIIALGYAPG